MKKLNFATLTIMATLLVAINAMPLPQAIPTPSPTTTSTQPVATVVPTPQTPPAPLQTITPVVPTPPATPAVQTTVTPAPAPTLIPAVQPTADKSVQANPVEFDQIATALAQLQNARNAIADTMKELDDKMQNARSDTAQAKKLSLSILSKTNEAEANAAFDQVNALLQKLQGYQTDVQNQTSKTIDQNYNQMQTQFAVIQEKIRNLQSRGVTLQVEQAEIIVAKAEAQLKELKKDTDTIKQETVETKGFVHSFFSGIADWFVAGGKAIYNTYRTVIEYLAGQPKSLTDADQKKKSNNTVTPNATNQSVAPTLPTPDKVRELLDQCNQLTKTVELSYISLQERSLRLEESIATWGKSSPAYARLTKLDIKNSDESSTELTSRLKQNIVEIFSWLLDGCMAVIHKIIWIVKTIYNTLFAGLVNKLFIGNVKDEAHPVPVLPAIPAPGNPRA